MLIDFEKAKKDMASKVIEERIDSYSKKLILMLDQIDQILDDIELSEIDWYKANPEQKEKIEAISTIGIFMETYAGWAKE